MLIQWHSGTLRKEKKVFSASALAIWALEERPKLSVCTVRNIFLLFFRSPLPPEYTTLENHSSLQVVSSLPPSRGPENGPAQNATRTIVFDFHLVMKCPKRPTYPKRLQMISEGAPEKVPPPLWVFTRERVKIDLHHQGLTVFLRRDKSKIPGEMKIGG